MNELFDKIKETITPLGGWTTVNKAHRFAAVVYALQPEVCVEIGVWCGRGSLAIALALKSVGRGVIHSIDPWSPVASVEGQFEADANHWKKADHEGAYRCFLEQIQRLDLSAQIKVVRDRSDAVTPPENIGFLVIDGNHGDVAILDVKRYAPKVLIGGLVYMDDLDWSTGSVRRASELLKSMGFKEVYPLEGGAMYQKVQ